MVQDCVNVWSNTNRNSRVLFIMSNLDWHLRSFPLIETLSVNITSICFQVNMRMKSNVSCNLIDIIHFEYSRRHFNDAVYRLSVQNANINGLSDNPVSHDFEYPTYCNTVSCAVLVQSLLCNRFLQLSYLLFFIWLKARLQPNTGLTVRHVLAAFTRWAITPTKVNRFRWNLEHSEYILGGWPWQTSFPHCWFILLYRITASLRYWSIKCPLHRQ